MTTTLRCLHRDGNGRVCNRVLARFTVEWNGSTCTMTPQPVTRCRRHHPDGDSLDRLAEAAAHGWRNV